MRGARFQSRERRDLASGFDGKESWWNRDMKRRWRWGGLYTEPFQLQAAGTDSGITSRGLRLRENSHRTLAGQADDPG